MRLDHLLSKEHSWPAWIHPFGGRCAGRWPLLTAHVRQVAAHGCGALVIHQVVRAARLVPPFGEWERRVRAGGLVDTLLGSEGAGVARWPRTAGPDTVSPVMGVAVLVGPVVF